MTPTNSEAPSAPQQPTGERFRGSSDIPLTPQGLEKGRQLAMKFARKGGLDEIQSSSLQRAVRTAQMINHYTHAPITYIGDGLHPWHQGWLEGQEITTPHIDLLKHLMTQNQDEQLPGRGPASTADGESFNDFKARAQGHLAKVIQRSQADPTRRVGIVTHYRVKKLLDAWMRKGLDGSGEIDSDEMARHDADNNPGGVDRLSMDQYNGPQMHAVDMDSPARLSGGIYLIRHENTDWNSKAGS